MPWKLVEMIEKVASRAEGLVAKKARRLALSYSHLTPDIEKRRLMFIQLG